MPDEMMTDIQKKAIDILHTEGCSCVIVNGDEIVRCHERGVKDLYRIFKSRPALLSGAFIADKVIGKGAAAIMVAGGVVSVYTDVISRPALELFGQSGIKVESPLCVDNIINRAGTGICPVEQLCAACKTAEECLPLIEGFINKMKPV